MSKFSDFINSWNGAYILGATVTLGAIGYVMYSEHCEKKIRMRNYRNGVNDGVKLANSGHDINDVDIRYDKNWMEGYMVPKFWNDSEYCKEKKVKCHEKTCCNEEETQPDSPEEKV